MADLVGAQALETLWCLPSPGYSGWLTVAEKDAWWRAAGYGDGMESFSRRMDHLAEPLLRGVGAFVMATGAVLAVLGREPGVRLLAAVLLAVPAVLYGRRWMRLRRIRRDLAR